MGSGVLGKKRDDNPEVPEEEGFLTSQTSLEMTKSKVEGRTPEGVSCRVVQRGPEQREGVPKKYNLEKSGGEFSTGAGNFSLH